MKELEFRHHKTSNDLPSSTTTTFVTSDFIDFNASQNEPDICNHIETLPSLPEISPELLETLEHLKELQKKCLNIKRRRKRVTNQQPKVSKMNGFTAFKSFYSRNFTALNQGVLSSYLSKVWVTEKNQHIWDLYAYLFRRYKRSETFSNWLLKNTNSKGLKVDTEEITSHNSSSPTDEISYYSPVALYSKPNFEFSFQLPVETICNSNAIVPYPTLQQPFSEKVNLDNIPLIFSALDYQLSSNHVLSNSCFISSFDDRTYNSLSTESPNFEKQLCEDCCSTAIYTLDTQVFY